MAEELNEVKYTLWYHSPSNQDFSSESFSKVCQISTLKELLALNNVLLKNDDTL